MQGGGDGNVVRNKVKYIDDRNKALYKYINNFV